MIEPLLLAALGYLVGSISSAVLVCRLMGLPDPRTQGSGNPGATNVLRFGGRLAGGLTLAGDFLKGTLPVLVAIAVDAGGAGLALAGLGAYLGHLYPVFFGFRGGKGVATGLGVLLGWNWLAALATVATWLLVAAITRISSLSALTAFLLAPAYVWYLTASPWLALAMLVMTVVTYWRHRSNIRNIIAGTEGRIGAPKT
jgi:glycerol-3-phosphate acyltransferase PlsY